MNMHFFLSGIYHGLLILAAILLTIKAIKTTHTEDEK